MERVEMGTFADLEIGIHKRGNDAFGVEFRYRPPDSAAESRLVDGSTEIDLQALDDLAYNPEAYGQALTDSLFADPEVRSAYEQARVNAESLDAQLRIRLFIHPEVAELHAVRWESLRDPRDGSQLSTNENLLFSRYYSTPDCRPVRLRLRSQMRALVAVASPSDLADYRLDPIDVPLEIQTARQGLGDIPAATLPGEDPDQKATLNNLIDRLRQERYDILCLVCHGDLVNGEPWLWLEDDQGKTARLSGADFAGRLGELVERPSLIFLVSCQSAGRSGAALTALGPRLAEVGVPAVVAMQGDITRETMSEFMPVFFKELQRDGVIDRAMAVARGAVRKRPDAWMPVLYMRLDKGRIWSGFTDPGAFRKWPSLISFIMDGNCTPILGPGLVDPIVGSHREIAQRWAEDFHYPMFAHESGSLPQVAQFLSVDQYPFFPQDELARYLREQIQSRFAKDLPDELLHDRAGIDELITALGANRRRRVPWDAYRVMASLPVSVYITANYNYLLEAALEEVGRTPRVLISPWNDDVNMREPIYAQYQDCNPTPERPLVYHLFGRLDDPESVVLTEDDYFKYMIGVTRNSDLVPPAIQEALTNRALLFLGFHLDDWNFRVLYHSLLSFEGEAVRKHKQKKFVHISVQIEPEGIQEPDSARRYLENYFREENIDLYWGGTEDFVKELLSYLPEKEEATPR
jgi:hypothetical protein